MTKFLGLTVDNIISWKKQIEQLASKLRFAGYSISSLNYVPKSLRTIYFSYVHSTISHGIIF